MQSIRFQAKLLSGHKEDAVEVPFDPGERWALSPQPLRPGRRGFPVRATLNGTPFTGAIVRRSGRFWLPIPASVQRSAGASAGDVATVMIAPDDAPP